MSLTSTIGVRKAYTPPTFSSFGKKSKDLFSKKYEFDNQAKIVNATSEGIAIETVLVAPTAAPLRAVFKSTIPVRTLGLGNGVFESTFQTLSSEKSTTSYKFNKLANNLSVKLGLTATTPDAEQLKKATPDFAEGWGFVEAEYSREYFAATLGVRSNQSKSIVDASAALGYDNLSVGATLSQDIADKSAPKDYNFGAQIDGSDYVASGVTKDKREKLVLSYFQLIGRDQTVGAQATLGLAAKGSRQLQFGTDYKVDVNTTVRAYATVESGKDVTKIATNVEHRLLNPNVLLGVSAEFAVTQANVAASRLGVALTFGEF